MKVKIFATIHIIFLLFLSQNAFAQQINGEATYGMKKVEKKKNNKKIDPKYNDIKSKIDFASSNIDEIEYKLFFNNTSQIFFYENRLGAENNDLYNLPLVIAKIMGTIYTDLKNKKTTVQKDGLLIEGDIEQYEWKLENTSKSIGQHICYKATFLSQL